MKPVSGNIGGEIEIIVQDKHGKTIKHFKKPMDSFVNNMLKLMTLFDAGAWNVIDTSGNTVGFTLKKATDLYWYDASILAPSEEDNYGILVGSSDAAFDVSQYNLQSKIPNGTGTGQLQYGETSEVGEGSDYKTWQRAFDNLSGADVTVKEIGIAAKVVREESGILQTYYVLLARDVITSTTVPNGGRLIVKYTFKINP